MREIREELDGWAVTRGIGADRDGTPAVVSLRVEPTDPDAPPAGGITGTTLRAIRMGRVTTQTYADLSASHATYADLAAAGGTYADVRYAPQRGRKHTNAFLLEVATTYDRLYNTSSERNLYAALATELGPRNNGRPYSRAGARDLVRKARRRGLLEKPRSRGRLGGGLTDRARQLLAGTSCASNPG